MVDAVALALPSIGLSDDEKDLTLYHLNRLATLTPKNKIKQAYYEGRQRVRQLGIAIPPQLRNVETVVGWPGQTVDVLEERLDFLGWTSPDDEDPFGLNAAFLANGLDADAPLAHLDALIYGTSFVIIGKGDDGEPDPLITVESPLRVTGEFNGRTRRLGSALSIDGYDNVTGSATEASLYLPDETITLYKKNGEWKVEDRDEHGFGRVPVVRLVNRPRASKPGGRSEITRAIRSYTDQGVRTMLGMEVNREFYSAPQRYALGADESAFTDKDGNVKTGWETVMGRMLALPRDEDGELPQVGQFSPASPTPYLEQMRGLAQLVSAEGGLPASYLGFVGDNPASADAIRAAEARLVKRAERRQALFGRAWREVAALTVLTRDGAIPDGFDAVGNRWRDAATPTRAASADEAVKLIDSGVLLPDSQVTYDRLGLTPHEQRQLQSEKRRASARETVTLLAAAARGVREGAPTSPQEAPTDGNRE